VQTVDFFTPVVDDPFDFGRVAAANALSDVYAMGGDPFMALNIVGFPAGTLDLDVLHRILRGAAEVCVEAEVAVVGGHSIDDPEPKFGLSVTGRVHPDRMLLNSAARDGDLLVLTKPLGMGILTTGIKGGRLTEEEIRSAVDQMATLNRGAAEVAREAGLTAATDVTGYGLLGHLHEMAAGSGLTAEIWAEEVPVLLEDRVRALIEPRGPRWLEEEPGAGPGPRGHGRLAQRDRPVDPGRCPDLGGVAPGRPVRESLRSHAGSAGTRGPRGGGGGSHDAGSAGSPRRLAGETRVSLTRNRPRGLELDAHARASVRGHGEDAYPRECCGFLLGTVADGIRTVVRTRRAANEEPDGARARYRISPESYFRAGREAEGEGLEVVGFYHSHPDGRARPSERDRTHALPGSSYVILEVTAGRAGELRSWSLAADRSGFAPEPLVHPRRGSLPAVPAAP